MEKSESDPVTSHPVKPVQADQGRQMCDKRVRPDSSRPTQSDDAVNQPKSLQSGKKRVWMEECDSSSQKSDSSVLFASAAGKRNQTDSSKPDHLSVKSESSMIQPVVFSQGEQSQQSRVQLDSSIPDHLSMKSEGSMIQPIVFSQGEQSKQVHMDSLTPDHLSMKSEGSMIQPIVFSQGEQSKQVQMDSSIPDHLSEKSEGSMIQPIVFSQGEQSKQLRVHMDSLTPDHLSMKSEGSMIQPIVFSQGEQSKDTVHQPELKTACSGAAGITEPGHMELGLCQEHNRDLAMLCISDKNPICKECAVKDHRDHEKQYLKIPAVPDTLTTLQNMLGSMSTSEL
ncbi:hypothetical protein MHYP_G00312250 [Metynnis hypsauchen]